MKFKTQASNQQENVCGLEACSDYQRDGEVVQEKHRTDGQIIEKLQSINGGKIVKAKSWISQAKQFRGAAVDNVHLNRGLTPLEP